MTLVAIVGMTGSGKSELSKLVEQQGYTRIRFGDITDDILRQKGLPINEENERQAREELRQQHGMIAYALKNMPKITTALKKGNVVIDNLSSWEEYTFLLNKCPDLRLLAVIAAPHTRYERLGKRTIRPLTSKEAQERDYAEIQNMHKAGPIAMADFIIINNGTKEELQQKAHEIISQLKSDGSTRK